MTTQCTRPVLAAVAAIVVLGLATGCSAAAPAAGDADSDELLATAQQWADAEPEAQREALRANADAVAAAVIERSGLAERTGMTASAIVEALKGVDVAPPASGAAAGVSTASYPGNGVRAVPAGATLDTARQDAFVSASGMLWQLRQDVDEIGLSEDLSIQGDSGKNGWTLGHTLANGHAGQVTAGTATTTVGGVPVTVDSHATLSLDMCPDEYGSFQGDISISGSVTHVGTDGTARRTAYTAEVSLHGSVNAHAFATDTRAEFDVFVETGVPGEMETDVADGTTVQSSGIMDLAFSGSAGTAKPTRVRASGLQGSPSSADTEMVTRTVQAAVKAAEQFWREGNCLEAFVTAAPDQIDEGGLSALTVTAKGRYDGAALANGRVRFDGNDGSAPGDVAPAGEQEFTGSGAFRFTAHDKSGQALPAFVITSYRGVARAVGAIEVGSAGWVIEGSAGDLTFSAVKCGGVVGEWLMTSTGPEGYFATASFTIDADLSGAFSGLVVSQYGDAGEVWLTEADGGYVFHATGAFDPQLPVRPATTECG